MNYCTYLYFRCGRRSVGVRDVRRRGRPDPAGALGRDRDDVDPARVLDPAEGALRAGPQTAAGGRPPPQVNRRGTDAGGGGGDHKEVGLRVHPIQGQAGVLQGVQARGLGAEIQGAAGERYQGTPIISHYFLHPYIKAQTAIYQWVYLYTQDSTGRGICSDM